MIFKLIFRKSQARTLRNIREGLQRRGVEAKHLDIFAQAEQAAKGTRPLVVAGTQAEAEQMADGFVRAGVARPRVEAGGEPPYPS